MKTKLILLSLFCGTVALAGSRFQHMNVRRTGTDAEGTSTYVAMRCDRPADGGTRPVCIERALTRSETSTLETLLKSF